MEKYFNINLQFNHLVLEKIILEAAKKSKGYCCFVDLNSLVYANKNREFKKVLNSSLVNSCDGSLVALLASNIYKKRLKEYTGPDFFEKYIFHKGQHLIIGSTEQVFKKIQVKVGNFAGSHSEICYLPLPFKSVEEFNYVEIANFINKKRPNFIWVSLGAPKQELFMYKLLPYIDSGILLGVGAAINYFSGEIKQIPNWSKKFHLIWLHRMFTEPKKQFTRAVNVLYGLPKIIINEKRNLK